MSSMGLHHKLCHTLGGSFNLPHAETHTVVLPHALAYNAAQRAARRWRASRGRSAQTIAARRDDAPTARELTVASAHRPRCRRSACPKTASTAPPTSR